MQSIEEFRKMTGLKEDASMERIVWQAWRDTCRTFKCADDPDLKNVMREAFKELGTLLRLKYASARN